MDGIRISQLFLGVFLIIARCETEEKTNKKFIPYFRRQAEELEERGLPEGILKDDHKSNIVSILLDNVKEIFNEIDQIPKEEPIIENDDFIESSNSKILTTERMSTEKSELTSMLMEETEIDTTITTDTLITDTTTIDDTPYENLTLSTSIDNMRTYAEVEVKTSEINSKHKQLPKNTNLVANRNEMKHNIHSPAGARLVPITVNNSLELDVDQDSKRSCIICNNVLTEDCNDPKDKLIQSTICERDDDICYSMHTPFGIVDRGCFNANHNLTIYVCSCNLCNYVSISEISYGFNSKREWFDNVIDITRTMRLRKSIFKDMSCLRCEVNTTQQKGDVNDTNCLEGNVDSVPVEVCNPHEVCAVKALRADGYIWRGCVKAPLYNYWWTLCDYDLCNCDGILSLYDFVS